MRTPQSPRHHLGHPAFDLTLLRQRGAPQETGCRPEKKATLCSQQTAAARAATLTTILRSRRAVRQSREGRGRRRDRSPREQARAGRRLAPQLMPKPERAGPPCVREHGVEAKCTIPTARARRRGGTRRTRPIGDARQILDASPRPRCPFAAACWCKKERTISNGPTVLERSRPGDRRMPI